MTNTSEAPVKQDFADEIRPRVLAEIGLTISIGCSFNKIFSKLGSDFKKPFGLTEITRGNYKDLLFLKKKLGKMNDVTHYFTNGWEESEVSFNGQREIIKSVVNSVTTPKKIDRFCPLIMHSYRIPDPPTEDASLLT